MKGLIKFPSLLWIQVCIACGVNANIASEYCDQNDEYKSEVLSTGQLIFYPSTFNSYGEYESTADKYIQQEYYTKLLKRRLELLENYLQKVSNLKNYQKRYLEDQIGFNWTDLLGCASPGELDNISFDSQNFSEYNSQLILQIHKDSIRNLLDLSTRKFWLNSCIEEIIQQARDTDNYSLHEIIKSMIRYVFKLKESLEGVKDEEMSNANPQRYVSSMVAVTVWLENVQKSVSVESSQETRRRKMWAQELRKLYAEVPTRQANKLENADCSLLRSMAEGKEEGKDKAMVWSVGHIGGIDYFTISLAKYIYSMAEDVQNGRDYEYWMKDIRVCEEQLIKRLIAHAVTYTYNVKPEEYPKWVKMNTLLKWDGVREESVN